MPGGAEAISPCTSLNKVCLLCANVFGLPCCPMHNVVE